MKQENASGVLCLDCAETSPVPTRTAHTCAARRGPRPQCVPPPPTPCGGRGALRWRRGVPAAPQVGGYKMGILNFGRELVDCVGAVYYIQIRKSEQRPPLHLRTADLVPQPRTPLSHERAKNCLKSAMSRPWRLPTVPGPEG